MWSRFARADAIHESHAAMTERPIPIVMPAPDEAPPEDDEDTLDA